MKKLVLIAIALCAMMMYCDNKGNVPVTEDVAPTPKNVSIETYVYNDSVFIHLDDSVGLSLPDGYSYFRVKLDLPASSSDVSLPQWNEALRSNILHWMLGAEREDCAAVVKEQRDQFFSTDGEGWVPDAEFECYINKICQNSKYVTFVNSGELNSAVSHVNPWRLGATFRMDGEYERIGYDLFVHRDSLASVVEKALLADENYSDEWDGSIPDFHMPSEEPWLENDSVVFCWRTYDMGSFAMGDIECKVSLDDLRPFLSEKGKALFN